MSVKINQVLLKFSIHTKNNAQYIVNENKLLLYKKFVVYQTQSNVLIFKFSNLTLKLYTKTNTGFIFLRGTQVLSNFKNIQTIFKYFLSQYIYPFITEIITKVVIITLNFHWSFSIPKNSGLSHTSFKSNFFRQPVLEEHERIYSRYSHKKAVFTVYKLDKCFQIHGTSRSLEFIEEIKSIIENKQAENGKY